MISIVLNFLNRKDICYSKFLLIPLLLIIDINATAQNFDFGEISVEELQQQQHPIEPDANAAILYRNHRVYYGSDFYRYTEVHERIKIYNKEGFDWANQEILKKTDERVTSLKAYTFNLQEGRVVKQNLSKNDIFEEKYNDYYSKTKFGMPAVKEGSVLEISYTLQSPSLKLITLDRMLLQFDIPLNRLEVKVDIPDLFLFRMYPNPRAPLQLPVSHSVENFKNGGLARIGFVVKENVYEVNADNIPSLQQEDYIDDLYNYRAFIEWDLQSSKSPDVDMKEYTMSWEDVAERVYNNREYSRLDKRELLDDKEQETIKKISVPLDKVKAVYALVKQKLAWNEIYGYYPQEGVKEAWKKGSGNVADINLALTAALKSFGLKAYPVLVSTHDNGLPTFPTFQGFNYVISAVEISPGQLLFLDGTEKTAGVGELPGRARNWQGRLLEEEGKSRWVDIMPAAPSEDQQTLNYVFDAALNLKGRSTHLLTGLHAKKFRDDFLNIDEEQYLQELERKKGDIRISGVIKKNEEQPGENIIESFTFEIPDAVEKVNDRVYLKPLLFLAEQVNPFKAEGREYPIFFDFPSSEKKMVNVMVPEGYKVEFLPESIAYDLNNGAGTYKFVAVQDRNMIRIESSFDLNTTVYPPQEYAALKAFFANMLKKQAEAIVLLKT